MCSTQSCESVCLHVGRKRELCNAVLETAVAPNTVSSSHNATYTLIVPFSCIHTHTHICKHIHARNSKIEKEDLDSKHTSIRVVYTMSTEEVDVGCGTLTIGLS